MTLELYEVIDAIADELAVKGITLGQAYKRRDPDEPGRALKERDEDRLLRLVKRRFAAQRRGVRSYLETVLPPVKAITTPGPDEWLAGLPPGALSDAETERLLLKLFIDIARRGVEVFTLQTSSILDRTQVNTLAAKWAREYVTEWLAGLDDTTRTALREALESFVTQPAFTMDDVISVLPFGEDRALRVAVTEVTRIYAEAAQQAGRELKKQYPDVRVEKRWWTNRDDSVCPICAPLHGAIVEVDDGFGVEPGEVGLLTPPAHVSCRCWISTRTRI